jgi:putative DNA primase/helicase
MLNLEQVKRDAVGKWGGVLSSFGVETHGGKHGPCPICGGKDRFRFDDKDGMGTYICNQCGAGDGWDLTQKALSLPFWDAVQRVAAVVGTVEHGPVAVETDIETIKHRLNKLWTSAKDLRSNDPVMRYLSGRGITTTPMGVRSHDSVYEPDTKQRYPAMVAKVVDEFGRPVTIHRTYLDGQNKANIESPRKLMPGTKKLHGVSVRLCKYDEVLGVAEGIETALSAAQLFNIPTWAVLSTSMMKTWEPPDGLKAVVVFGDNDKNFAGQKAAYALAGKLSDTHQIEVNIPDIVGDWNDVLLAGG